MSKDKNKLKEIVEASKVKFPCSESDKNATSGKDDEFRYSRSSRYPSHGTLHLTPLEGVPVRTDDIPIINLLPSWLRPDTIDFVTNPENDRIKIKDGGFVEVKGFTTPPQGIDPKTNKESSSQQLIFKVHDGAQLYSHCDGRDTYLAVLDKDNNIVAGAIIRDYNGTGNKTFAVAVDEKHNVHSADDISVAHGAQIPEIKTKLGLYVDHGNCIDDVPDKDEQNKNPKAPPKNPDYKKPTGKDKH